MTPNSEDVDTATRHVSQDPFLRTKEVSMRATGERVRKTRVVGRLGTQGSKRFGT
jgi:hypothetical protein